ncbi:MAG: hypothetical protein LW772_03915 [Bacteroidetes bacterium]|jgi:hypothetical protein|nr:hypothetical protein [Bacteroidota bacterium]
MEFLVALTPLAIFPAGTDTIFILCLIVLPALLVFFTAQYMMKQHITNSVQLVKTEILKTNLNTFTPLKLQAYERIALFLERTSIPALIQSYAQAGQSARGFAAAATHAIKEEYSYNVSQQIYVSSQMWTLVKAIKEQHLQLLQNITASLPAEATAADLSQKLIEFLQSMDVQPQDRGMEFMKNEIALTLGQ